MDLKQFDEIFDNVSQDLIPEMKISKEDLLNHADENGLVDPNEFSIFMLQKSLEHSNKLVYRVFRELIEKELF